MLVKKERKASDMGSNRFSPFSPPGYGQNKINPYTPRRRSKSCFTQVDRTEEADYGKVDFWTTKVKPLKEGFLIKKTPQGRSLRRKYVLKDNLLYHYHGQELWPSRMVFLIGCYINDYDDGMRYGFKISHDYRGFRPKTLLCGTR